MSRNNWIREELIAALNLYVKLGFTKINAQHPKVIALAKTLGRTPSAVSFKLANFARLDPELQKRGVRGMSHGSDGEKLVWNEFYNDFEKLAEISEPILAEFKKVSIEESVGIPTYDLPHEGRERDALIKQRVNQNFFREMILGLYRDTCCITGIHIPQLLIAGHIMEWSKDNKNRMNPTNGLCLNMLHDKAYEKGLISITPDYEIKISSVLKDQKKNETIQAYFIRYENQKITLPHNYLPSPDFLNKHYNERFIR